MALKILVTGGVGFIGSHVVDALINQGYQVVVVDDLSAGSQRNLNPRARLYKIAIQDPALGEVFAAERPDCVNHHAAQMSVRVSVERPLLDAEVNILGSLNVLEACRAFGVKKLVYISTGGAAVGEPRYLPVDEKHPADPVSPYGVTKHTVEHYLYLYKVNYGLNYTVLRYPNVYGPRQDPYGEAGVVAIFIGQMLRGEPVTINGTGEQERDFVYVADIVDANLLALEKGDGEVYNLGSGVGTSVNEIFRRLARLTGYTQAPRHGPPLPGEVFKIYLDATKARRELGWQPAVSLEEGLSLTVDFFRKNPDTLANPSIPSGPARQ